MAAFAMVFALGAALAAGRCMPPPKGVPKRDGGAAKDQVQVDKKQSPTPEQKLDAAVLKRVAPLKTAKRVHLLSLSGPLDDRLVARLKAGLSKVQAGEVLVLEVDAAGGSPKAAAAAYKLLAAAKVQIVTWVRGSATGEAAVLPLASHVVALAPSARLGALGSAQFTGQRLSEADRKRLTALFAEAARLRGRPEAWARAMVTQPGAPTPADKRPVAMKPEAMKRAAMKRAAMKPAAMKPAAMKPAAMKPAAMKPAGDAPPLGSFVTLTARQAQQRGLAEVTSADLRGLLFLLQLQKAEVLRDGKALKIFAAADARPGRRKIDLKKVVAGTKRIVVVDIKGMVELGMLSFVQRTIGRTKRTDLVVIDVDTLGGRVDAAIRIRDALLRAKGKTVAFINPRAISAGALISLACDLIIMAPGGSIGAATPITVSGGKASPVGEKYVSYMRKEMKATAEAKGRRGDLAEAMVDMSIEVKNVPPELKESISGLKKGKLLTLTTDEALKLDMVEGKAASFDELVDKLGLKGVPVTRPTETWAEKVSRFLISPAVSGLLMLIGLLGLFIEARTPGFGVAGTVGVVCLLLVLFGHKIAGLGGWEPLLIFLLGVALLAVELFVTPGFGVLGGLGILAIVTSLVWAIIGAGGIPLSISWDQGYITSALARVFGVIILTAVLGALLVWLLPKAPGPLGRLVLSATVSGDATAGAHDLPEGVTDKKDLVGKTGVAETALRPTGRARIDGARLEVESRGGFVKKGAPLEVVQVSGRRIVVKEVSS